MGSRDVHEIHGYGMLRGGLRMTKDMIKWNYPMLTIENITSDLAKKVRGRKFVH